MFLGPHGKTMLLLDRSYIDSENMSKLKGHMIDNSYLEIGTMLGSGQFGKVFLGSLQMTSGSRKKVAVKTIKGRSISFPKFRP